MKKTHLQFFWVALSAAIWYGVLNLVVMYLSWATIGVLALPFGVIMYLFMRLEDERELCLAQGRVSLRSLSVKRETVSEGCDTCYDLGKCESQNMCPPDQWCLFYRRRA